MNVSAGESLLVDVMVKSMMLSRMGDCNEDDIDTENIGEVLANAFLYKDCSELPCDDGDKLGSVFPGGLADRPGGRVGIHSHGLQCPLQINNEVGRSTWDMGHDCRCSDS